jgi:hypothetical protein
MIRLSLRPRSARSDESRRINTSLEARIVDLLMRRGERTRALKIAKEAKLVDEADLLRAIAAAGLP